ncbi:MAG TPA: hypothetical protein VN954_00080 [Ktedonobacteraceae bacterium]|nr:hypothetical protein [Ktedonobacteraceae bacterium]
MAPAAAATPHDKIAGTGSRDPPPRDPRATGAVTNRDCRPTPNWDNALAQPVVARLASAVTPLLEAPPASSTPVVTWRHSLDAQVAAAPRAAQTSAQGVSRREDRPDPSRSGHRHRFVLHNARLCRTYVHRARRTARGGSVLIGTHRGSAKGISA